MSTSYPLDMYVSLVVVSLLYSITTVSGYATSREGEVIHLCL